MINTAIEIAAPTSHARITGEDVDPGSRERKYRLRSHASSLSGRRLPRRQIEREGSGRQARQLAQLPRPRLRAAGGPHDLLQLFDRQDHPLSRSPCSAAGARRSVDSS